MHWEGKSSNVSSQGFFLFCFVDESLFPSKKGKNAIETKSVFQTYFKRYAHSKMLLVILTEIEKVFRNTVLRKMLQN